jgi:hypothetical protein
VHLQGYEVSTLKCHRPESLCPEDEDRKCTEFSAPENGQRQWGTSSK